MAGLGNTRRQSLAARASTSGISRAPPLSDDPPEQAQRPLPTPPRGPHPGGPSPAPSAAKIVWKRALKQLSSLKLAIAEMAVILGLSAVGTIIEQNKPLEFYVENYPDGPSKVLGFLTYRWIYALELDHIYTASYFLALMALLAASLAACTSTRQWPMVKVARRWRFAQKPERVYANGELVAEALPSADIRDLAALLEKRKYQIFLKEGSLYAFKGLAGKVGPIGVHASMLLCMAGIAYGGLSGFKGTAMVPEGGDFIITQALRPSSPVALPPRGAEDVLHVNSFNVDYREDGSIKQYYSDLSIQDVDGKELTRKTISVNVPLRWKGVTAYQTDWSIAALTLRAAGSPLAPEDGSSFNLPMANLQGQPGVKGQLWGTFVPAETPNQAQGGQPRGVSIVARDFQTVVVYNSRGEFVGVRRPGSGKVIEAEGLQIVVDDLVGSTGLELKVDPGVPFVYAGFAGLMITTIVSYFSHAQIWALQDGSLVHVGGRSNRAIVGFKKEMNEVLDLVPERVP
ncbi:hypothetical protein WJX72_001425 [[Myrmecia] bisecta]|uniref:ResB-like domain-containing protein n=1 Tax=[Myrmecia] bisecta TaxID=41462 RepID=A0AAW1P3T4_9CHLO